MQIKKYTGKLISVELKYVMANTYTQIHIHFVFAVKYRKAIIHTNWRNELYRYISGIIKNCNHKLLAINGNTHFEWQEGYGAFSYSKSQLKAVIRYIENQESHHKKQSFREEFVDFLEKSEVDYDEKFIFKELI